MTTTDAAKALGVTPARVIQLIRAGRLSATKTSGRYDISDEALHNYVPRPVGRPRKNANGNGLRAAQESADSGQ
jgi:excisionase family DNA binding protein